jgi:Holliday junction DNA helicase RuvA
MNILSSTGAELLSRAISSNDPSYMTKISGVGKKTAEKIVLELKDHASFAQGGEQATTAEGEALDALETLGYQIRDTRDIVRMIANKEHDASSIVREALKQLGKK